MNCTCGVEIAAQSSIGGKCARCAAKTPMVPPPPSGQTVWFGAVPVSNYQDTTLPNTLVGDAFTDDGLVIVQGAKEYERVVGPPTVRKKGK